MLKVVAKVEAEVEEGLRVLDQEMLTAVHLLVPRVVEVGVELHKLELATMVGTVVTVQLLA